MTVRSFRSNASLTARRDFCQKIRNKTGTKRHLEFFAGEMEKRQLLATFTYSGNVLSVIADTDYEEISIASATDSGNYTITSTSVFSGSDIIGELEGNGTSSLTVYSNLSLNSIQVLDNPANIGASFGFNTSSGNFIDSLSVNFTNANAGLIGVGTPIQFTGGANLSLFNANNQVSIFDSLSANGSSALSLSGRDIYLTSATIATGTGLLSLNADNGTQQSGDFAGVFINQSQLSTAGGSIMINGRGGDAGSMQYGVKINQSSITASGPGDITINANSGVGSDGDNTGTSIIESNLTTENGSISLQSTSLGNGSLDFGISLLDSFFQVANQGNIQIVGNSGSGNGISQIGVELNNTSLTVATGNVSITGNSAGNGTTDLGIWLVGGSQTTITNHGNITIMGQGGSGGDPTNLAACMANSCLSVNSGQIEIAANSLFIDTDAFVSANNSGTISVHTLGAGMILGGDNTANALGLTNATINQLSASTISLGNSSTANISIVEPISISGNLALIATGPINQSGNGSLVVSNSMSINTFENEITLNNATNDFNTISASGSTVSIIDINAIVFETIVASNLVISAGGSITQTGGNLTVGGSAILESRGSGTNGNITLGNVTNDFNSVSASGTYITLTDANNINLGAITPSSDLLVTASNITITSNISNAGQLQSYTGVVINGGGSRALTAANVNMSGTLKGADAAFTITGNANIAGSVANITDLIVSVNAIFGSTVGTTGTVGTVHVTGTTRLGGNVNTTTTQAFDGALTAVGARTLTGTSVVAGSTVTGNDNALTIIGNANTTGAVANLTDILVTGNANFVSTVGVEGTVGTVHVTGTTRLGGNVTTTTTQAYDGALTVVGARALTGTSVFAASTVTGNDNALTITGNANTTGAVANLTDLLVTGNANFGSTVGTTGTVGTVRVTGTTLINGGNVTTTGLQSYNDAVTLGANTALNTTNSNIGFNNTLNGAYNLGIATGSGNVSFGGNVGQTSRLGNVSVTSANVISASGNFNATNIFQNCGTLNITTPFNLTNELRVNHSAATANIQSAGSLTATANLVTGNLVSANLIAGVVNINGGIANMTTGSRVSGLTTLMTGGTGKLYSFANANFSGGLTVNNGTLYTTGNATQVGALAFGPGAVWNANAASPNITSDRMITATNATISTSANLTLTTPGSMRYMQNVTLVKNTGSLAATGNFSGLPQNAYFTSVGGNDPMQISYSGGSSGKDVVATVMAGNITILPINNNLTASSGAIATQNLTFQALGGNSGNTVPVPYANVVLTMPADLTNMNIASGAFNGTLSNRTITVTADANGNFTVPWYGGAKPGPFNLYPAVQDNVGVTGMFNLGVIGLAVERQSIERSYIRYLDIVVANPSNAPSVSDFKTTVNLNQIKNASTAGGANITAVPVNITSSTVVKTAVGYTIDFGTGGITPGSLAANPGTTDADGVYQFSGNSTIIPAKYTFHRLLGDANGDKVVDAADTSLVNSLVTQSAWSYVAANGTVPFQIGLTKWAGDTNGDGVVNALDINITGRWRGRKVTYNSVVKP